MLAATSVVFVCLANTAFLLEPRAQQTWRVLDTARPPAIGAMAYDSVRDRIVLSALASTTTGTEQETWEWNSSWARVTPANSPTPRNGASITFDTARGETLLFGGAPWRSSSSALADTWTWDGVDWSQRSPTRSPPARSGAAMSETGNGTVLMFGGRDRSNQFADTWEWDGVDWQQRVTSPQPPSLLHPVLARSGTNVVLCGRNSGYGTEMWEWDGISWTQLAPTTLPNMNVTSWQAMAADPTTGNLLLVNLIGELNTWEWDGVDWAQRGVRRERRSDGTLCFHGGLGRFVYFGGVQTSFPPDAVSRNLLEWSGSAWRRLEPAQFAPPMAGHAATFDAARGVTLIVGTGERDTWTLRDAMWTHHPVIPHPTARRSSAITYDSARHRAVLFGGMTSAGASDETWEWDGNQWALRNPTTVPPARSEHGIAFDTRRGVAVMAGGVDAAGQNLADTWEWDGIDWRQRSAPNAPSLGGVQMTHDSFRERTVLVPTKRSLAIWEWDGSTWKQRFTGLASSSYDVVRRVAYDPVQNLVFIYEPDNGDSVYRRDSVKLMQWNGLALRGRTPTRSRETLFQASLHFDARYRTLALFGGVQRGTLAIRRFGLTDSLVYVREQTDPAFIDTFGKGCGANAGQALAFAVTSGTPVLGSQLVFQLANIPSSAVTAVSLLGHSMTRIGSTTLPLDLAPLGAPGCSLEVAPDLARCLDGTGGFASWRLALPNDTGLLGLSLFLQAAVQVPGSNALGLLTSNGVALRIGSP